MRQALLLNEFARWPVAQRNAAYDNAAAVADSAAQIARFELRSRDAFLRARALWDLRYGPGERQLFDYFPGQAGVATFVFIHGGYWQTRHKNLFRFVAAGAGGMGVALIGYELAPRVTIAEMARQVRLGIAAVRACALRHGAGGDMLLCGWSAGAHLAALALDCEGVVAGLGISGIYDLEPICHTALNQVLQLQARDVARLSPRRLPVVAKPFVIAWGARELPQLQAQSLAFAEHRRQAPGRLLVLPEADHFSILDTLSQAENPMVQALRQARQPGGH